MPPFAPEITAAVLAHMNGDHPDDNLLIARAFGSPDAATATMTSLDQFGGSWRYSVDGDERELTLPWRAELSQRAEIRHEVVALYDAACAKLGVVPRQH